LTDLIETFGKEAKEWELIARPRIHWYCMLLSVTNFFFYLLLLIVHFFLLALHSWLPRPLTIRDIQDVFQCSLKIHKLIDNSPLSPLKVRDSMECTC
jgi:hypothetical protein